MKRKIENKLLEWKNKSSDRKPLLLYGARQVGKTYILREFGKRFYKNVVYINLETNTAVSSYFDENIAPATIIRYLEATVNEEIHPEHTLIILDEIQSCERALTSLKYFCEEAPEYHIAAAGSLLGVAINRKQYSFPVGKVDSMTLYPLDFEEFMWAVGEEMLCEEIHRCYIEMNPLTYGLHKKAIDTYRLYLIVGGLPAVVLNFAKNKKLLDVSSVQNEIISNYIADMAKYASNSDSVKIRACYNSIPAQLGKDNRKFQYKVVQKGGTATIFGASIEWLLMAGVVIKCQKADQGTDPISVYSDLSSFKIYMSDVGLLVMKSGISHQTILSGGDSIFMGALTENYVASQIIAKGDNLYYWESDYSAEVDFVIQRNGEIYAIEVKSGEHTKSKSLNLFIEKYKPDYAIRFSLKIFGETDKIKSIPLYAAFCL